MTYTVIYSTTIDDIPLRMFDDPAEANDYANTIADHEDNDDEPDLHDDVAKAFETMGRDAASYTNMAIAHHDLEGKLVEWDVLVDEDDTVDQVAQVA